MDSGRHALIVPIGRLFMGLSVPTLAALVARERLERAERRAAQRRGTRTTPNELLTEGSGWVLRSAEAINEVGQIVGYGTFEGQTRAFLLTPAGG